MDTPDPLPSRTPGPDAAPLLLSADPLLVSDVQRLAAAAGVVPLVVHDSVQALRAWSAASVVLVGADCAAGIADCRPPRRPRVHLLGRAPVGDGQFRHALALGAETVSELPASETWLVEMLTDVGDGGGVPGVTVGVVGGSGGAGATVLAAAVARAAAEIGPTLLVDADPLGAGLDRVLGLDGADGIRWDALHRTTGRLSTRSLREALPRSGDLSVLTWPPDRGGRLQAFAVREVLSAGRRGFATVVVDLPRHPDPVAEEATVRCDHVVVVSRLTVPAVSAASRVAARLPEPLPRRHLVTRGGAGGVTPESAARLLRLPLLAAMSDQRGLDESIDLGAGPGRAGRGVLVRTARSVVRALADPVGGAGAVA
ncbi:septum site-determining protein Ssd [Nocardioides aurantiacus]|uniref:Secretion/DNA translocation related CpaE-like protein n=1 Tax=Nocardioides aurantiacus TaxID=86796 RepID=A0A3N2CP82_9ACTN|nr:septum site-determining protein Ssd [Nocardioides aurantiacus]ROR89322.1 secretion/DNA translocation related CpaE-like protein [Nocardioides aurantiacus]